MRTFSLGWLILCCGAALPTAARWAGAAESPTQTIPRPEAHAHNDYLHPRPLLDALDRGFCSVEADIWLVEGRLLVAHDRSDVRPERTLESLYLRPLRDLVRANGGHMLPGWPVLTLLVDIKSEAEPTYSVLREVLNPYQEMLTTYGPDHSEPRAVRIILSGNRPREALARETLRYAAFDGRLSDLDSGLSRHLMPLVSDNWAQHFQWRGEGPMPTPESVKLERLVDRAHRRGYRLRFWGTPDRLELWGALLEAGVDLIGTDDLEALHGYLLDRDS